MAVFKCKMCGEILNVSEGATVVKCDFCGAEQTVAQSANQTDSGFSPLLERAFLFLEDGEWARANEYFEKVLDLDPKCANAYLGKLMAELQIKTKEQLVNCVQPFDNNRNYEKIMRFGDEQLKVEITSYSEQVKSNHIEATYIRAKYDLARDTTTQQYNAIIVSLQSILDYKDSKEIINSCNDKIQQLKEKAKAEKLVREQKREVTKRKIKKTIKITFVLVALITVFAIVSTFLLFSTAVVLTSVNFHPWTDIVAIDAGYDHTVGLKADGTVVADGGNSFGQCDVSGWTDIVAISAGFYRTVGLREDGTVVAVGAGQCDVSGWKDIVAIDTSYYHTVGLKSDGTVVATGHNYYGQCDVGGWTDIVAISADGNHTVGLKSDGTVVATGYNGYGRCDVGGWTDIIAISAGGFHTVGLKSDGTVVAVGKNDSGQCDVSGWKDIVAISAGVEHTVGLREDGTVVATGYNDDGRCNTAVWKGFFYEIVKLF